MPANVKETTEDVESEVKNILVNNFKCDENNLITEFDKAHRIGGKHDDNTQTIIVRFKSHSYRSNLYVGRKIHQNRNGNKLKLRISLTNTRRKLLSEVQEKVAGNDFIDFAYASVNGDIRVRTKFKYNNKIVFDIKSSDDIDNLLVKFNCSEAQAAFDEFNH